MTVESSFGPAPLPSYSEPEAVILASPTPASGNSEITAFEDKDGPSFSDLIDILNPLQHIPIINTIYQQLTGDKEGAVADLVGGTLWGGLIGLGAAVANLVVEDSTGKSIGGNVVALFSGDDGDTAVAKGDHPADRTETAGRMDATPAVPALPVTVASLEKAGDAPSANGSMPGGGPIVVGNFLVFGGLSAAAQTPSVATARAETGTAAPPDAGDATASAVADGPTRSGEFLVFGQTATAFNAAAAARTETAKTVVADAGARPDQKAGAGSTRVGDFMVFGAGQPAANDLPVNVPAATNAPTPLTPASAGTDKTAPAAAQTAASGAPAARSFPIPTQRNMTTPPQVLPMPTTGPAAVPGNARAISSTRGGPDQTGSTWFAGAFNEAMDKYNRAAGLGSGTAATAQGTADGATANSVLQMN
jgi:hypothetical protein